MREREREGDRFDVRLLQSLLGRAYRLSLMQGHHAATAPWGRGCLCGSPWVRRGVWMGGGLFCTNQTFSASQSQSRDVTMRTPGLFLLAALQYVKY